MLSASSGEDSLDMQCSFISFQTCVRIGKGIMSRLGLTADWTCHSCNL